jgi:uncharacterized SAM-binding protein YcdF (DUF218 family)
LTSLLLSLVMPPTGCAIAVVVGLLLVFRWRRFGSCIAWLGVAALLLMALPVVSDNLMLGLETGLPPATPPADHPPGAIVVLGGEVTRSRTLAMGVGPGPLTLERVRTAAELARRTGLPILVTGGITQPDTAPVAAVMAASLRDDFRLSARWIEDKSRDTWQNARFSAEILRGQGITSVYVVTSAWHMRRALLAFQATTLTVTPVPTPPGDPVQGNLNDFLPHASAWQTAYYALHEWIGYAWYKVRGAFENEGPPSPNPLEIAE